ncbi:MAG: Gfo/Idh/MocA family oxidoreductase [Eubacterium sp.]|nr:Gfo/Idh/MocA family oxidoreductase [Eubacterium sp.]
MIEFKVGILGAGQIAGKIADTLNKLDGFTPYAVASRDKDKAVAFGTEHNIKVCYGSYDELIEDPEVELIYVATVNSTHAELAKKCINAGKPSLIEKPFSYNSRTAAEIIKLSEEKKVYCGEAMWLRYTQLMNMALEFIKQGAIGDVRTVTASLGYDLRKVERVLNMETAGGALLDLGIYPITMVFMIMGGPPISVASNFIKLKTGVDAFSTIQMGFQKGKLATITSSMMGVLDNRCMIYGTEGRMEIDGVTCPERVRIYTPDGKMVQELTPPERYISGYEYEFIAAREAIIVGRTETPYNTNSHIMALYSFTDALRKSWGEFFPLPGEEELKRYKPQTKKA